MIKEETELVWLVNYICDNFGQANLRRKQSMQKKK